MNSWDTPGLRLTVAIDASCQKILQNNWWKGTEGWRKVKACCQRYNFIIAKSACAAVVQAKPAVLVMGCDLSELSCCGHWLSWHLLGHARIACKSRLFCRKKGAAGHPSALLTMPALLSEDIHPTGNFMPCTASLPEATGLQEHACQEEHTCQLSEAGQQRHGSLVCYTLT